MLVECIVAVWPKPCSACTAAAMQSSTVLQPHEADHRHQQLGLHEGVRRVDLGEEQPRARRHPHARGLGDLGRVLAHPVAVRVAVVHHQLLQPVDGRARHLEGAVLAPSPSSARRRSTRPRRPPSRRCRRCCCRARRRRRCRWPRLREVRRLVDHRRRVARAGRDGALARVHRRLHHRGAAGHHDQPRRLVLHQRLRRLDASARRCVQTRFCRAARRDDRLVEQLDEVRRTPASPRGAR